MALWGGIEAGGTKFVCAVASGPDTILAETRFPTRTPSETIGEAIAFFRGQRDTLGSINAVGIASFGPVDPNPASPTFGYITTTPKPGWAHCDFAGPVRDALSVPVGFDTDVNGAALAEGQWGAAEGLDTFVYLTVGTGIGGGAMVNGQLVHGMLHPEMGHVHVPHDLSRDPYPGRCPYHKDCLEGLACGPAIEERWGQRAASLPPDHPAWELEAEYIAQGLAPQMYILSPQRIILGGGVMEQAGLLPMIRERLRAVLNGYIQSPLVLEHMDQYLVAPGLGNRSGVLGAIALAQAAGA